MIRRFPGPGLSLPVSHAAADGPGIFSSQICSFRVGGFGVDLFGNSLETMCAAHPGQDRTERKRSSRAAQDLAGMEGSPCQDRRPRLQPAPGSRFPKPAHPGVVRTCERRACHLSQPCLTRSETASCLLLVRWCCRQAWEGGVRWEAAPLFLLSRRAGPLTSLPSWDPGTPPLGPHPPGCAIACRRQNSKRAHSLLSLNPPCRLQYQFETSSTRALPAPSSGPARTALACMPQMMPQSSVTPVCFSRERYRVLCSYVPGTWALTWGRGGDLSASAGRVPPTPARCCLHAATSRSQSRPDDAAKVFSGSLGPIRLPRCPRRYVD